MNASEAERAKRAAIEEHERCQTEVIVFARCLVEAPETKFYMDALRVAVEAERAAAIAQIAARQAYVDALDAEFQRPERR